MNTQNSSSSSKTISTRPTSSCIRRSTCHPVRLSCTLISHVLDYRAECNHMNEWNSQSQFKFDSLNKKVSPMINGSSKHFSIKCECISACKCFMIQFCRKTLLRWYASNASASMAGSPCPTLIIWQFQFCVLLANAIRMKLCKNAT
jgi:hypothetical protein